MVTTLLLLLGFHGVGEFDPCGTPAILFLPIEFTFKKSPTRYTVSPHTSRSNMVLSGIGFHVDTAPVFTSKDAKFFLVNPPTFVKYPPIQMWELVLQIALRFPFTCGV